MLQIVAEFSKFDPDVRVDVRFMVGNPAEENIKPHVVVGTVPDLLSVGSDTYSVELVEQHTLANVSQISAWTSMFGPLKWDWTSRRSTGFGTSGGATTAMIYYNREIFKKASIDKSPVNFDEFLCVCAQLEHAGFTPMMLNGAFPNMLGNGSFVSGSANNVIAYEPSWKNKMTESTLDLDTPEVADIFAKMALLPGRGYVQASFTAADYGDSMCLFKEDKVVMTFQGNWAAGQLLHGSRFTVGAFIPPWSKHSEQVVPALGNEIGLTICETPNEAVTRYFLEFTVGKGFLILQRKCHNISPSQQDAETAATNLEVVDYTNIVSCYLVTASPYYSTLPSSTLKSLRGLIQDVLLRKISPCQAAK